MKLPVSRLAAFVLFAILSVDPVYATPKEPASSGNSTGTPDDGVTWIFPTSASQSAYNSVDTIDVQWQSAYEKPSLALYCKPQDSSSFTSRAAFVVAPTGSQSVSLDVAQVAQDIFCHFTLQDTTNFTSTSSSAQFTIVKARTATPQTWSATGSTGSTPSPTGLAASSTAPTTSSATSASAAPTSISTFSPASLKSAAPSTDPSVTGISSTHGLSTAAGVGIGIGVAVLVTLLALGALLLYLHIRQKRRSSETQNEMVMVKPHAKSDDRRSQSDVSINNNNVRVIPGVYETVGNRPVPQELDAYSSTLTHLPNESFGSDTALYVPTRNA